MKSSIGESSWKSILGLIEQRVSKQKFETWFARVKAIRFDSGEIVLEVPNPFFGDWFEEHHMATLREAVREQLGQCPPVRLVVSSSYEEQLSNHSRPGTRTEPPSTAPGFRRTPGAMDAGVAHMHNLHPRFTFDNFIIGKNNEFAAAVSQAVAQKPGTTYNPLFIYGGTGLGKTHLMQAIGHAVLEANPRAKVLYAPAERFMNEMIQAIRAGQTHEFRRKYRNLDVLLLDDIHFLSGRESTQEEFFHTFNALHHASKQIVVTSDRAPKEIQHIESRIVSRFHSGIIADIQPPDFETRVAILKAKALRDGVSVPDDVVFAIAERIQTNVRELEGCLVRLSAMSRLIDQPMNIDLALEVLRVYSTASQPNIDVARIQEEVARRFGVPVESLRGKKRTSAIAFARQVAMYLTKRLCNHTLVEIGKRFGNRDHSTVIYGIEKIERQRQTDPELDRTLEEIERSLTR